MPLASSRPVRRFLALAATLSTVVAGGVVVAPAADALVRGPVCAGGTCTEQLGYPGGDGIQQWTVPAGVTSVRAQLVAGDGVPVFPSGGGVGGVVEGIVPVTPGEVLTVRVGAYGVSGGYGGGSQSDGTETGGGGGSFLSSPTELLLVAGGGGSDGSNGSAGGDGGGGLTLAAEDAEPGGGGGASPTAGGAAGDGAAAGSGPATTTTFGYGGPSADPVGLGGGGGGYYGGGGGALDESDETFGGGGGSGYKGPGVTLVEPGAAARNDRDGSATFSYDEPAVTTTSTIALDSDHAVAGTSGKATVTVTASADTDFAGGRVQLLVDGKKSGPTVATIADGRTATAKLPVPTTVVGAHKVSAAFTGTDAGLASTADPTPFTVVPSTIPWTLTDEAGHPITSPLSTPDVVAHATGQLPGATVRLDVKIDGTWTDPELDESGVVAADGTVDVPIASPLLLTVFSDDFTQDATFDVRLVAVSTFEDVPDLASSAKRLTVPGIDIPVDLQVDPGPYRAGGGVDGAVRVTISWFDLDEPLFSAEDLGAALDEGALTLFVDRRPVDPADVGIGSADDETAVLTFAAPEAAGDHTVQAVLDMPGSPYVSASDIRHFTVAPSTFDAALLDENGDPVTKVHAGDKLHAAAAGLLTGTKVDFTLHSDPVRLGSATADEDGLAVAAVTIPADAPAGKHTLVVTATDVLGDTHVQKVAVTVVAGAPAPAELPVTGSSVQPLLVVGTLLLLVGAGLVLLVRRRTA